MINIIGFYTFLFDIKSFYSFWFVFVAHSSHRNYFLYYRGVNKSFTVQLEKGLFLLFFTLSESERNVRPRTPFADRRLINKVRKRHSMCDVRQAGCYRFVGANRFLSDTFKDDPSKMQVVWNDCLKI